MKSVTIVCDDRYFTLTVASLALLYLEGTMEWLDLIVAGLFEIGWPLGFEIAENPDRRL
jgi:hypothetical protein